MGYNYGQKLKITRQNQAKIFTYNESLENIVKGNRITSLKIILWYSMFRVFKRQ